MNVWNPPDPCDNLPGDGYDEQEPSTTDEIPF